MTNALEIDAQELIEKAALQLKENSIFTPPTWATYVKTGMSKDRPPVKADWWYMRVAAILRSVYKLGPVGTSKLRTKYGGRKNRGYKPERFYRGGCSIIRKGLQQLEKAGYIAQVQKGVHKGRKVTKLGKSFLDKIATQLLKEGPKVRVKKVRIVDVRFEGAVSEEKADSGRMKKNKKAANG